MSSSTLTTIWVFLPQLRAAAPQRYATRPFFPPLSVSSCPPLPLSLSADLRSQMIVRSKLATSPNISYLH